ncbi:MAG: Na(+)-translocating NADH-quinone reductase subunit C [Gammaproteobacteria bacterium]|nr:Na(+)-translocating NADH-quinone reductase subunit C [Gammaproteobacteria bacterium]MDH3480787.1 Na(+)-translocating NADH-quinone reductase subunit C [Gammaproteobacteria bacterium]
MSEKKEFDRDSISNTLIVAVGLSLVCSVIVSSAAIVLKPVQEKNEEEFRQKIILDVAGLMEPGRNIEELFGAIEPRMVDLETGDYTDAVDPAEFDALLAASDSELGIAIPKDKDIAGIGRRAKYAPVYIVRKDARVDQVILPVYGKGLWSTMLGYLSVAPDGKTVSGFRFYAHAETPGLGDQIDKEPWLAQWPGKLLYDADNEPKLRVIKGTVPVDAPDADYMIDGLSGATLTANGVTGLVQYWTGSHGFGPYLKKYREDSINE